MYRITLGNKLIKHNEKGNKKTFHKQSTLNLKLSQPRVAQMIKEGKLPTVTVNGAILIKYP